MDIDPARLNALAHVIKDAIVTYYGDNTIDLPERRAVLPGLPAADCEMLGVHVLRVFPIDANTGTEVAATHDSEVAFYMRAATIVLYLVRCLPPMQKVGQQRLKPPAVAAEEAVAAVILADPTHMWRALAAALDAGTLPGCGSLAWESWESVTPQGGLGGGTLSLRVSLE